MRRAMVGLFLLPVTTMIGCPPVEEEPTGAAWCGVEEADRPPCDGTLPARFDTSTTVEAGCYLAAQTPRLGAGVTLTLAPGVTILFAGGAGLDVSADQVLIAAGTADAPVCLSGQTTARGAWDGLRLDGTAAPSVLAHVVVEYGGDTAHDADAAGIKATADSRGVRLTMTDSTVRASGGWGLWLAGSAVIDGFARNTLTGNTLGPASVDAEVVGALDTATRYTGNDVDQLRVRAYRLSTTATWADLGVPYFLESSLAVQTADWTLAPGVTLIMDDGTGLDISTDAAALIAVGTAAQPIVFTGATAARGAWRGIRLDGSNHTRNALSHVVIEWAGNTDADVDGAALKLTADSHGVQLAMSDTTLRQSAGWGFYAVGSAVLPGFSGNVLTENALGPARVGSLAVQQLLPDSDYTGNDVERLRVHADYVAAGAVWQDLGVPYALDGTLEASAPWTLDAGVTLIMLQADRHIMVAGNQASLTAVGTAERPIVLTADPATKASWQGLVFDTTEDMAHVLDHVVVEYAGQLPSLYPGAITTHSDSRPIHLTVTHSTFQHNAGYGLWLCGSTQVNADVESSNSFVDNDLGDYLHD